MSGVPSFYSNIFFKEKLAFFFRGIMLRHACQIDKLAIFFHMNHNTYQFSEPRRIGCTQSVHPNWSNLHVDIWCSWSWQQRLQNMIQDEGLTDSWTFWFIFGGTSLDLLSLFFTLNWNLVSVSNHVPVTVAWSNNVMILKTCSGSLHCIRNLVSCGSVCHYGNFSDE